MMGMIYGFDNDGPEIVGQLIEFINSTHAPLAMVGLLTALPNTKLWERLKLEERLTEQSSGNNTDGRINFIPNQVSAQEAEQGYIQIIKGIYNEKAFFGRVMKELKMLEPSDLSTIMTPGEIVGYVRKIMTKRNALTYWRYFPQAHRIAKQRFGSDKKKYAYLIGHYITTCARYTHLKAQTEHIERMVKKREYQPWQKVSWKEIQDSKVECVELVEKDEDSLYEVIKMRLDNGYEYIGTRLDALSHFVQPYIREGMKRWEGVNMPSIEQLREIRICAYIEAHLKKPQILEGLDTARLKDYLEEALPDKDSCISVMQRMFREVMRTQNAENPS